MQHNDNIMYYKVLLDKEWKGTATRTQVVVKVMTNSLRNTVFLL